MKRAEKFWRKAGEVVPRDCPANYATSKKLDTVSPSPGGEGGWGRSGRPPARARYDWETL